MSLMNSTQIFTQEGDTIRIDLRAINRVTCYQSADGKIGPSHTDNIYKAYVNYYKNSKHLASEAVTWSEAEELIEELKAEGWEVA